MLDEVMTREEAIIQLKGLKEHCSEMSTQGEIWLDDVNALDMAIKALEQEPKTDVLDKIRADIEQKCCITAGRENEPAITLYDVFQIIDKYKAESEVSK